MSDVLAGEGLGTVAARVARRSLRWQQGCFYWGDAILYDGLLAVGADGVRAELAARLERWARTAPDSWDDALAPGLAAARLVEAGELGTEVPERVVAAVRRLPEADGVPLLRPHVPEWRSTVWVDGLYHLPPGLAAAARVLGDASLRERALVVAEAIARRLEHGPALAHAYDAAEGVTNRVLWTRGIGWALLGLLDLTGLDPAGARAFGLELRAVRLFTALQDGQRADGHWGTVLDEPASAGESSVAAFYLAAALHPTLPAGLAAPGTVAAARAAVLRGITPDGVYLGVSRDTHVRWETGPYLDPPTGPSAWGQGACLRALAALRNAPTSKEPGPREPGPSREPDAPPQPGPREPEPAQHPLPTAAPSPASTS
jgi:unsaturated rhamnogalacturonyl hydrolase